jgi:transcriptional regulator of acetoin/glycerol metabolism
VEHAIILSEGEIIDVGDLPEYMREERKKNLFTGGTLEEIEKRAIEEALRENDYKIMKTSRQLGIYKNTLRRKILKYGIETKRN